MVFAVAIDRGFKATCKIGSSLYRLMMLPLELNWLDVVYHRDLILVFIYINDLSLCVPKLIQIFSQMTQTYS